MTRGLLRGAVCLGWVLVAAVAAAQDVEDYKDLGHRVLASPDDPFVYYVDGRNPKPAGTDLALVRSAVAAAFKTWQDVDCAWPAFQTSDAGVATNGSPMPDVTDPYDGFNVVPIWVTDRADPRYVDTLNAGSRPGAAKPLTFNGYVYQCDIYLNGVPGEFNWSTLSPTPAGAMDLQSVLTREIGHCLGLGDTLEVNDAVMSLILRPGESRRQLSNYDRTAVCRFYPQAGAVGSPCTTTCTNGLTCVSTESTVTGNALRMCTRGCTGTTGGECPAPYVCRDSSGVGGSTRACLPALPNGLTPVGKACDASVRSCVTGTGRCILPSPLPSGQADYDEWEDGYCTETCTGPGTCPIGSECADVPGQGKVCLKTCASGTGDCRPGYSCSTLKEGDVCLPSCVTNADCRGGTVCRNCDSVCVSKGTVGRQIGDACTADDQCGTDQFCFLVEGNTRGVCAQACSVASCLCPAGTTCQAIDRDGKQACVKECVTGTCESSLRCAVVATGVSACMPSCLSEKDCAPGMLCGSGGTCYDPTAKPDAGSCTLCNDGGTQPPPVPDAGTKTPSSGGPGGCGCQGAPASAVFLGGVVMLLWLAGRRRTWHKE
ncbi:adhesin [Myxococcus stipitatus]|uniref:adhesin n=1 Tax=Myxococcus stipitatus TaxID=83455 RepID=UPI001F35A775|nr:adhesin [Myxococcus stipitatus]MCE9666861.1 adhesin [Myxococcus stipitatus]